jgi:hypothetical protein
MSIEGKLTALGIVPDLDGSFSVVNNLYARNILPTKGNIWYADSTVTTSGSGKTWERATLTIAEAVALASAGDTILISGSFTEAVTVSLAGLRIIGVGTGPNMATWTAAADAVCLTLSAVNCLVSNIKFRPPARSSGSPAAVKLSGAGYTTIKGCRFQGKATSYYAIYSPVCDSDNVTIEDCEFIYMNTATYGAAILGVEAGGLSYNSWKIKNCIFNSCVTAININGRICVITGCTIMEYGIASTGAGGAVLALGIDLSGTSSYGNAVWGNQLGGTYNATLYKVGATGDQWGGNFNALTGGVTAVNPA